MQIITDVETTIPKIPMPNFGLGFQVLLAISLIAVTTYLFIRRTRK